MENTERLSPLAIFIQFLKLGCISFGGPVAHLGFYQEHLVRRKRWLTEQTYADLVALCQFLPGPASSQVGFGIGYARGGVAGAFAAWTGFTLPSAVIMIGFALGLAQFQSGEEAGWLIGLKLAAVAVVANAIWNLAAKLCPDRSRALMALGAAAFLIVVPGALWQVALILLGLLLGWLLFRGKVELTGEGTDENEGKDRQISGDEAVGAGASAARRRPASGTGWPLIAGFFALLFGLPMLAGTPEGSSAWLAIVDGFYRAGSLVFGGGHVVLPLLDSFTVARGWISSDAFLAGYGVAQAIPGPLFTFSAFLGASFEVGPGGVWGGLLALLAIYVPSFLLVLGVLPYWERIRRVRAARAALLGANAVVVGLLLAAFYNPIWTAAGTDAGRVGFALVAFALLRFAKVPPWALVIACGLAGGGLALGPIDVPGIF